jgi:hypothetical protein
VGIVAYAVEGFFFFFGFGWVDSFGGLIDGTLGVMTGVGPLGGLVIIALSAQSAPRPEDQMQAQSCTRQRP